MKTKASFIVIANFAIAGLILAQQGFSQEINTLTDAEGHAGFELLFDGSTSDGWVRDRGSSLDLTIVEGTIATEDGDICTEGLYGDFEFTIEYKYTSGSNSGIFLRTKPEITPAWLSGIEIALQDNGRADNLYKTGDGAIYDIKSPAVDVWTGPDEWNTMTVWVVGDKIENWHNGEKVIDVDRSTQEWTNMVNNSKFSNSPFPENDWGQETTGRICLQDHGGDNEFFFRSLRIREIDADSPLPLPIIEPPGGTFEETTEVTIYGQAVGSELRYTLDGSVPDAASDLYEGPINVSENTTLKAIVIREGYASSDVVEENYEVGTVSINQTIGNKLVLEQIPLNSRQFKLKLDKSGLATLYINSPSGRRIREFMNLESGFIDLKNLESGIYYYVLKNKYQKRNGKFIIK